MPNLECLTNNLRSFLTTCTMCSRAFTALTLLVGRQEGLPGCKNWVVRYWRGYLSGARCKWLAYGPADATATPSSLAPVKSRMVYLSGSGLPRFSWKRPLNGCSSSISISSSCSAQCVVKIISHYQLLMAVIVREWWFNAMTFVTDCLQSSSWAFTVSCKFLCIYVFIVSCRIWTACWSRGTAGVTTTMSHALFYITVSPLMPSWMVSSNVEEVLLQFNRFSWWMQTHADYLIQPTWAVSLPVGYHRHLILLEHCSPWPHVANRHIFGRYRQRLSQLFSLCRHSYHIISYIFCSKVSHTNSKHKQ